MTHFTQKIPTSVLLLFLFAGLQAQTTLNYGLDNLAYYTKFTDGINAEIGRAHV